MRQKSVFAPQILDQLTIRMRHTDAMRPTSRLVVHRGFHCVSSDSRPVSHEIGSGHIESGRLSSSPRCKDQLHCAAEKEKGNLHCRDVRHMRGANSLGDQEPKVSLSPSDLEANFIFFDENKQPPLPSIWLCSAGPVHCDSVRTDIVASPLPLLGHHALAHPRGVRVHATGSCRNTISVATCITIKQDVR
jgi:hypothetical protein